MWHFWHFGVQGNLEKAPKSQRTSRRGLAENDPKGPNMSQGSRPGEATQHDKTPPLPGAMRPRMRPTSLTPLSLDLSDCECLKILNFPWNFDDWSAQQPKHGSFHDVSYTKMYGFLIKIHEIFMKSQKSWWFQHFTHHFAPRSLEGGLTRGLIWPPGARHRMGWIPLIFFDRFGLFQYHIITYNNTHTYIYILAVL